MSAIESIRKRTSCRAYDGRPLTPEDQNALTAYIQEGTSNPFDVPVRLMVISRDGTEEKLGTYGMIAGARTYLVGAVRKGTHSLAAYGYVTEGIVLKATGMGIGTCWLGGTFTRSSFAKAIGLGDEEVMPAVTPLGYARQTGSLRASLVKAVSGSRKRKPWGELFFQGAAGTPLSAGDAGEYADCLEMVRIGPSAVNKQPWRIVREGDAFHFCHAGGEADSVDIGIAMCHFEAAAREKGLAGHWEIGLLSPGGKAIAAWVRDR